MQYFIQIYKFLSLSFSSFVLAKESIADVHDVTEKKERKINKSRQSLYLKAKPEIESPLDKISGECK